MKKYILLSIKPKYIKEIISGDKIFEFRKKFPSLINSNISNKVIIYSSKPTMAIVGSFEIKHHYHDIFSELMVKVDATPEYNERISRYFSDKSSCHALEISNLIMYESPLNLQFLRGEFDGFCPGQSYRYLDRDIVERISLGNKDI